MRLLVILSRFPYPLEKGDKLRAYHQLVNLSHDHEIILCCLTDKLPSEESRRKISQLCLELHVFKLSKIKQLGRLCYAAFSSKPFQVHYFYQESVARKIQQIIQRTDPAHIYAQLVRTTEYVKNFHDMPKTLDYMDALNKNYSRRTKTSKGIRKFLVKEEAKRLVAYENLIFDYFENHSIISSQDKNLIYHEKRESISVVPNGVDFDYFKPSQESEKKTTDIIFTGNMGYLPNEDAALHLIRSIMPMLWEVDQTITLTIAGAIPSNELLSMASNRVKVTGWVNDIRNEFNSAKIFLAPMRQGTGLQNKLLEAMSMQLPCITTPLANNALKAIHNEHLHVYQDDKHLVTLVMHLLNNSESRLVLGTNARKFILDNYSWQSANKILQELITTQ
ncbi:MAG: glycosyltransferase [Flavobacteriales bacterium]